MFSKCSGLTNLDVTNFNTSLVISMTEMFRDCGGLTSLNITNFDTSKVKYMNYMFYDCFALTEIKISTLWDVSNVTDGSRLFENCALLPNFHSFYTDVSMAKPTTQGGYLTLVGDPATQSFIYGGKRYYFVPGSTWNTWINSVYNYNGFSTNGNYVVNNNNSSILLQSGEIYDQVLLSDLIVNNGEYTFANAY